MKTLSIDAFVKLAERDDWHIAQEVEVVERLVEDEVPHIWGAVTKTSTLGDITITYTEGFNYDEFEPDTLTTGTEGMDIIWTIKGVRVVDEEGDELDAHELADYLDADFKRIDYSVLGIEQVTDVGINENSNMVFTLEIDNAPSLRFTGERVASAAGYDNQAMGSSSSALYCRWTELELYKTVEGKFICHQVGRTRWIGERDRFSGKVCDTVDEVIDFFGHGWLAKELYEDAGIDEVAQC